MGSRTEKIRQRGAAAGRILAACALTVWIAACAPAASQPAPAGAEGQAPAGAEGGEVMADTRSFTSRVVDLEALLQKENDTVAYMAAAAEAAPSYQPGGESGPTKEQFIADLTDSYRARCSVLNRYSEFPVMSNEAYNEFRFLCGRAEYPFYEAYSGAEFEDRNFTVLCSEYLGGLEEQYEAENLWRGGAGADEVEAAYFEGYDRRSAVLIEVGEYYAPDKAAFQDLESLTAGRNMTVILPRAVEANKTADSALVTQVQQSLNAAGFDCGTADGKAGKNTVLAICHAQLCLGQEADGLVSQALADALAALAAEAGAAGAESGAAA